MSSAPSSEPAPDRTSGELGPEEEPELLSLEDFEPLPPGERPTVPPVQVRTLPPPVSLDPAQRLDPPEEVALPDLPPHPAIRIHGRLPSGPELVELLAKEIPVLTHLRDRQGRQAEEPAPAREVRTYASQEARELRMIELQEETVALLKSIHTSATETNLQSSAVAIQASGALTQASAALRKVAEEGCRHALTRVLGPKLADAFVLIGGGALLGASAELGRAVPGLLEWAGSGALSWVASLVVGT